MIDDYSEAMELLNMMKNGLPIPAYPSKGLISQLKQRNIKSKPINVWKLSMFIIVGMWVEFHAF